MLKFCKIVSTRLRNNFVEIDIIAYKNNRLVFVEMKSRTKGPIYLYESISYKQKKRIVTADNFFMGTQKFVHSNIRFDVIFICP
ncbi:MAG: YraN family protein [Rickettsiales endosymbiont of Dermacentor nuttalli]